MVNDRERQQIALIAKHELEVVERILDGRMTKFFGDHSLVGRLQSGANIKVSVDAMREIAERFLIDFASQTKVIALGQDAYSEFTVAVNACLKLCEAQLAIVVATASGHRPSNLKQGIVRVAADLFAQMRADIQSKLAIMAYEFDIKPDVHAAPTITGPVDIPVKKGGRPPAEFWDDMWAEIAVALYKGDLAPKSQADVERAMIERIEALGHSAAESTVRARARRLWDRLLTPD